MATSFDKAIAAVVVPLIVLALAHFGFNADPAFQDALAVIVAGIVVYLIPNKAAAASPAPAGNPPVAQ